MQNNKGLRSGSDPDRPSFPTIDDARDKVQEAATILDELSEQKHPLAIRRGSSGKEVKRMSERGETKSWQVKGGGRTCFLASRRPKRESPT